MLHVGLTGNIASGKSHAVHVLAELGAHIIDADRVAHELMSPGTTTYAKVVEAFGEGILNPDRTIFRKKLGGIIFHDAEKRALLNNLVHPDVRTEILRRIIEMEKTSKRGIVIIDAALMVESGFYKVYDRLIVVHCEPALQLSRIISRDGLSVEEAKARIAAQMPAAEKLKYADYTIDTSGTFRQTHEQVEAIYRDLVLVEAGMQRSAEG